MFFSFSFFLKKKEEKGEKGKRKKGKKGGNQGKKRIEVAEWRADGRGGWHDLEVVELKRDNYLHILEEKKLEEEKEDGVLFNKAKDEQ